MTRAVWTEENCAVDARGLAQEFGRQKGLLDEDGLRGQA
jgi:hypothetical protein